MDACKVDAERSPQFKALCRKLKRNYPRIEQDLQKAFKDIAQDFRNAKHARRLQSGPLVEVYKYNQASTDIKRGSGYGFRIDALYDKQSNTLYPILVYSKTEMQDASDATILGAVREIRRILGYCMAEGCAGKYAGTDPPTADADGTIKLTCTICGCISWQPIEALE